MYSVMVINRDWKRRKEGKKRGGKKLLLLILLHIGWIKTIDYKLVLNYFYLVHLFSELICSIYSCNK